jgi:membrane protease YdiL (CAAX protease family)
VAVLASETVRTVPPLVGPAETDLPAFVWLTGFVLTGFLILARLSQGVVDDGGDDRDEPDDSSRGVRVDPIASAPAGAEFDAVESDAESEADAVARPLAPDGAVPRETTDDPRGTADDALGAGRRERSQRDGEAPPVESTPVPRVAEQQSMSPGLLLLNVALTQGLFGAILAGGAWYFGVPLDVLGVGGGTLSTGLSALAVGTGFGLVLWVGNELASGLAAASGAEYDEGLRELLAPDDLRAWVVLLGATLPVIAVVEEFIFRAAVVGAPAAAVGVSPWVLAVVSSVAFALGHGAQGRVGVAVTGALGLALAAGFVLTESLLVVVVAHYLVNALEFLVHEGLGLPDPVWS